MKKSILFIIILTITLIVSMYVFFTRYNQEDNIPLQATAIKTMQNDIHLESEAFFERIRNPNMVTIDVRTPQEYDAEHIDGAINIDFYADDFIQKIGQLDKESAYSVYCRSGSRSGKALNIMNDLGFKNVVDLKGGYRSINQ